MGDVLIDGSFEFGHAGEHAAAQPIGGDVAEEAIDHVEPRRRGLPHTLKPIPVLPGSSSDNLLASWLPGLPQQSPEIAWQALRDVSAKDGFLEGNRAPR